MALYISNPTKQQWVFFYRDLASTPDARLQHSVKIPSGGGIEIGSGWSRDQLQHVIAQIEAAGGRDAAEAHRPIPGFRGLLYRVNGQIEADEIIAGHDSIVAEQQQRSVDAATKAALGFDRAANAHTKGKRAARSTSVEVIELPQPHSRLTGNEVNFSLTVDPEGHQGVTLRT